MRWRGCGGEDAVVKEMWWVYKTGDVMRVGEVKKLNLSVVSAFGELSGGL